MDVQNRRNPNLTNLWVDGIVLVGLLIAFSPNLTGLRLHEWLGLAFGITLWVHTLLHWEWLVKMTRRFFTLANWLARFKYLLDAVIFVAFTVIIFSGVMESRYVLQAVGLSAPANRIWESLHRLAVDLTIWLAALHIALHWRWVWGWIKKLLHLPTRTQAVAPQLSQAVEPVKVDNQA